MGALYVIRAAGSHTLFDLVAFFPSTEFHVDADEDSFYTCPSVWGVQCKRDGKLKREDNVAMVDMAWKLAIIPMLAKAGTDGKGVLLEYLKGVKEFG
jgi:hypothetical protein